MFLRIIIVSALVFLLAVPSVPAVAHQADSDQQPTAPARPWDVLWAWFHTIFASPTLPANSVDAPLFKTDNEVGSYIDPDGLAAGSDPAIPSNPTGFTADEEGGSMMEPDG